MIGIVAQRFRKAALSDQQLVLSQGPITAQGPDFRMRVGFGRELGMPTQKGRCIAFLEQLLAQAYLCIDQCGLGIDRLG